MLLARIFQIIRRKRECDHLPGYVSRTNR